MWGWVFYGRKNEIAMGQKLNEKSMNYDDLAKKLILIHKPEHNEPWVELLYNEDRTIQELVEFGNDLTNLSTLNSQRLTLFFRGQGDSNWRLQPKLYRLIKGISKEWALRYEFDSIGYFKQQAHLFLNPSLIPKDDNIGKWLALMQQYSAPTRMLDWTTSFYVAFYFAVTDEPLNKPGAVWFFDSNGLQKWMGRYENLSEEEVEEISSCEEKFVEFGINKAQQNIEMYESDIKTERMIPQQSIFTFCHSLFCDHADPIGNALWDLSKQGEEIFPLTKIIVSPEAKKQLRIHLNKLNLTASTLFPGIDGIGRAISEIIRVQCETLH